MTIPYTYLVGWKNHNLWYYGCQYAVGCHPKNLWTTYFTSSKKVKMIRKVLGEPDVILIRKTFSSPEKALMWENKVLRRLNASNRKDFINLQNGSGDYVPNHDEYMRAIVSEKMKTYWTPEKRSEQSEKRRRYCEVNGTESMSIGLKRRYSNTEYHIAFTQKMTEVNARQSKKDAASKSLKARWTDPEFRLRMSQRKPRGKGKKK